MQDWFPRHTSAVSAEIPSATDQARLPRLYSITEICTIFNRSPRTVRAWCQTGYLVPVRIGRAVFFTDDSVQAVLSPQVNKHDESTG